MIYKREDVKALDMISTKKKAIEQLETIGLRFSPKWNRAIIPKQFTTGQRGLRVVRGYADTDGRVIVFNNNGTPYPRIEMKISPSPMQNQIIEILTKNGFEPRVNDIGNGKVRIMISGKKKLMLWLRLIGFSNERNKRMVGRYLKKEDSGGWI